MSGKARAVLALFLGSLVISVWGCGETKREMITVKVKDQDQEGVRFAMVHLEGQEEGKSWVVIDSALTDQRGLAIFSPSRRFRSYQVTVSKYGLAFGQLPVLPNRPAEIVGHVDIPPSSTPAGEDLADADDLHRPGETVAPKSDVAAKKPESQKPGRGSKAKATEKKVAPVPDRPTHPSGFSELSTLEQIRWYSSVNDPLGVLSTKTGDLQGERQGEAMFYRAMAYTSLEKPDSALITYESAMRASPRLRSQALLNMGVIYMRRSRLDDAMKAFDDALLGQLSEEKRGLVYLNQASCKVTVAKLTKQKAKYLQGARQDLMVSKDLLCTGRVKGRDADCKRIEDLVKTIDKMERETGRR